jgi:hypothetical protein
MRSWNTAIEWQAVKVNVTILNEQRSTQESQNLPWWESQKRIHQIIKVIDRILNSVCIKEEWHKATMCQLQTTQQDN